MSDKTEVKKVLEKVDKMRAYLGDEKLKTMKLPLKTSQICAFGTVYADKYKSAPMGHIDVASKETGMQVYEV